jgi:hypothetical protein
VLNLMIAIGSLAMMGAAAMIGVLTFMSYVRGEQTPARPQRELSGAGYDRTAAPSREAGLVGSPWTTATGRPTRRQ